MHYGHVRFFERASRYGRLTVAVNTDEFCNRYKRPPVMTLDERAETVAAVRWVDCVTVNDQQLSLAPVIEDVQPDFIVHAGYTPAAYLAQIGCTQAYLDELGVTVIQLDRTVGISTSDIIERLAR